MASIEQPESVIDSFIFSPSLEADEGVGESSESSGEATALASSSFEESLATLRVAETPREMHEVEGLFSFSVFAPMRGSAFRSAVG